MEDIELELRKTFLEEAQQILDDLESALMTLEGGDRSADLINKIFRLAHNFKGSARSVGFVELSKLAHVMEDVLTKVKQNEIQVTTEVVNALLSALDQLKSFSDGLRKDPNYCEDVSAASAKLEAVIKTTPAATDAQQVDWSQGFGFFDDGKPVGVAKSATPVKEKAVTKTSVPVAKGSEEEGIRISSKRLDALINLVGEIVVNQAIMNEFRRKGETTCAEAQQILGYMEKLVVDIQDLTMALRLVPVKPLFQKLRRTVRDIAPQLGKSVEFVAVGEHVEVDKTVLDKIVDPLTHMIRNAVDHGIEPTAAERVSAGKPEAATIKLMAEQKDDRIFIQLSDDGRGLNKDRILRKAIEKGLVERDAQLSDDQIHALIFLPGFSTNEQVSDISGRGVGMEVVKKAVEDLKGSVLIESTPGKGTTFGISLPLSLSIIGGMIVSIDERRYVIPITQLIETIEYSKLNIEHVTGRGRVVNLRGEVLPVLSLSALMHSANRSARPKPKIENSHYPGIVTSFLGKKVSFEVDEIIGQQNVVLKKLGEEFNGIPGILGGAILSNGQPGLVLNLHDFIPQRKRDEYGAA